MKKLGAVAGIVPNSSRRKLPSISTSATSSVSPRPSDSTTAGVSAPGRWMLPTASRKTVERTRGARRASAVTPMATTRRSRNAPAVAPTKMAAIRGS